LGNFCVFSKTVQSKQSPIGRKFAQSGHIVYGPSSRNGNASQGSNLGQQRRRSKDLVPVCAGHEAEELARGLGANVGSGASQGQELGRGGRRPHHTILAQEIFGLLKAGGPEVSSVTKNDFLQMSPKM
jgi:hypothetical protein